MVSKNDEHPLVESRAVAVHVIEHVDHVLALEHFADQ